jgi:hypothetical protein
MMRSSVLTIPHGDTTANYPDRNFRGVSYEPGLIGKPYATWSSGAICGWYATEREARIALTEVRVDARRRA